METHLTPEEVLRRLKALVAMPPDERPITIQRLEKLAGFSPQALYRTARLDHIPKRSYVRLDKAFRLLEGDQVRAVPKSEEAPDGIQIVPPKPPQVMVRRVKFTAKGPRVELIPMNPLTFPNLPPKK